MITSLTWVPKGAARARPVRFELSPEEYQRIKAMAKKEEDDEKAAAEEEEHDALRPSAVRAEHDEVDLSGLPSSLRMDAYDDDEAVDTAAIDGDSDGDGGAIDDDDDDGDDYRMAEVVEQGNVALAMVADDDDDEDADDDEIRPTDALLVVAITEDEFSHLEVQLLSEDGSMFVHHDIALPEFPLCLAWMDCPPFQADGGQLAVGNYVAVGSFDPAIEIWNLDVLDPLEPTAVLGGVVDEQKVLTKKKKGAKKKGGGPELNVGSHEDAVMGLSWNKKYRQALASGSADTAVKVWDVTTQACQHTFAHHTDKVQSVAWHPEEAWLLASGSFDRTVALLDCRSGTRSSSYRIGADVEGLAWDPFSPFHLYCAMEDGSVACMDMRLPKTLFFTFQAHDKTTSSISFSSGVRGMFATASIDKTVKVWDASTVHAAAATSASAAALNGGTMAVPAGLAPRNVMYKSMNVGKLFTMQFFADDPFVLATAGDKGSVAVWESDEADIIQKHFQNNVVGTGTAATVPTTTDMAVAMGAPSSATAEDDSWMDDDEPKKVAPKKGGKAKPKTKR
jgi:periodic tryptophan protein 1